jgi:type IV secretory pathway VirB9-like protein
MKITTAILLVSVSLSAISRAMAADPTIRIVSWSPTERTEIIGVVGQPTTITFPTDENVYRVVQSVKQWDGPDPNQVKEAPLGNNLTIWPTEPGVSAMTVITMPPTGTQKVYNFKLLAKPDVPGEESDSGAVLNLIFKGGSAPAAPTVTTSPAVSATIQSDSVPLVPRRRAPRWWAASFNPADGLCHYVAHGRWPTTITPHCPMDNGQWTLMRFPDLSAKPAIYIVGVDGGERLARQHGDGDFVVVEEIAQHFRLRLGPEVLDILNNAHDPAGRPAGTGTTSTEVQRDVLQAGRR